MSNNDDSNNWYLRSLMNIADDFGQARMNKSASVKKAIAESFDLNISSDQAKGVITLMSQTYKGKDRISYMTTRLVDIIQQDEIECKKIASFLSNFKR